MGDMSMGKALGGALLSSGFVRWTLAVTAICGLFIGAGGGAGISVLLAKSFVAWKVWMYALPGAGWAVLIALAALWMSMAGNRRLLYFRPRSSKPL